MGAGASEPTPATVPDVCRAFNSKPGQCTSDSCLSLHICLGFVTGNCLYGEKCSRTHLLSTVHNQLVLKVNDWGDKDQSQLLKLLKEKVKQVTGEPMIKTSLGFVTPQVCLDYNTLGCARGNCNDLHLCLNFILNKCHAPEGTCPLGHDLSRNEQNMRVLRDAALLDTDQRVIVENLKEKYKTLKTQTSRQLPNNEDQESKNVTTVQQTQEQKATLKHNAGSGNQKNQGAPSACIDYNKRSCMNPSCPFLHVCFSYIMGRCNKKDRCPKEHNIFRGDQNKEVLRKFGLLDAKDVFAKIREGYEARAAARAARAAASESSEGATGGAAPSPSPAALPGAARQGTSAPASLTCSVCCEPFIRATTLGCTHTFCEDCVRRIKRQGQPCPLCRAPIATTVRSLVIDNTVADWFASQSDETQRARRQLEAERRRWQLEVQRRL